MDIFGKTALISGGGAHRVGRAVTLMLAEQGANVVINYHTAADAAQQTAVDARTRGVDAREVQCDITDPGAVQRMVDAANTHFGGVDILVNNAGLFLATPLPTTDLARWRQVVETSIYGTFYLCNALIPTLTSRQGTIVNILDGAYRTPWTNFSAHAVGKAGMWALTRQLAADLAPHVRVNAVTAGPVLPPERLRAEAVTAIGARTLLGRWGEPDDVAGAVRYLIEADYVTGTELTVDGGEHLR